MDELLVALKALFVKLFEPFLASFVASLHAVNTGKSIATETVAAWDFSKAFDGWDKVFDKLLRGLEDKAAQVRYIHYTTDPLLILLPGPQIPAENHHSTYSSTYSPLG